MQPLTLKQLEYQIIRLAEQYPDRVGLAYALASTNGDHCITGQIAHDLGVCPCQHAGMRGHTDALFLWNVSFVDSITWQVITWNPEINLTDDQKAMRILSAKAVLANNAGHKWGEIPRMLGLVPGEEREEQRDSQIVPQACTATGECAEQPQAARPELVEA